MQPQDIQSDLFQQIKKEIEYHQTQIELLRKKLPTAFEIGGYDASFESQYKKIHTLVCTIFDVPLHFLNVKTRKREYIVAKQSMALYLRSLKKANTNTYNNAFSLQKIGDKIGLDHATILYSCRTMRNLIETNKEIKEKMQPILIEIDKFNEEVKKQFKKIVNSQL
jgi:chromosomal replication initiation ATPase DnaA